MVDENKIAFRPAVELSYLTETEQHNLLNSISYNDATPRCCLWVPRDSF